MIRPAAIRPEMIRSVGTELLGIGVDGPNRTGASGATRECEGDQSRPSRSAFFASYSSALIAPRSRRSARFASVRVTSSADIDAGAPAGGGAAAGGGVAAAAAGASAGAGGTSVSAPVGADGVRIAGLGIGRAPD